MKSKVILSLLAAGFVAINSCNDKKSETGTNILFLHHSTGGVIWEGDLSQTDPDAVNSSSGAKAQLPYLFAQYNKETSNNYSIKEMIFPKASPYGWNNYPYDYYNIWVKHGGDKVYMKEPTLEMLTKENQVIIFKHCFPVSNIVADTDNPDINSNVMSLENYKLQYMALRDKLHEFSGVRFILFTGAVQVKSALTEEEGTRAREFYEWVTTEWDQPDDNIFLWDLYQLQTEGGLYFKDEYAVSMTDSHPNKEFAGRVASLLFSRITDVIESNGMHTSLTGEKIQPSVSAAHP